MATAHTQDNGTGPQAAAFYTDRTHAPEALSFNPASGPTAADAAGLGVPASTTHTGPAHAFKAGQRVAVQVQASAPGVVNFEGSPDGGATWPSSLQQALTAGEAHWGLITPAEGSTHYRVSFTAGQVGASSLWVTSQPVA